MSSRKRAAAAWRMGAKSFRAILFLLLAFAGTARAATTELVISDWQTGIALYGFDPVAFFVEKAPRRGSESIELNYAGAVFRFANEGNRAAFEASPDTYIPRFGGYDPLAIARGSPAPGFPSEFVVRDGALFFFSNETSKAYFLASPAEAIAAAEAAWPRVKRGLVH